MRCGDEHCSPEDSSPRKAANRQNAVLSTGPKTPEGRAASARNALKHGLLSRQLLLEDESAPEFRHFHRRMMQALVPVGALEQMLAERVTAAAWRLRRFELMEARVLGRCGRDWRGSKCDPAAGFIGLCSNGDVFSKLSRYETGIERSMLRALHELQRLQAARSGGALSVPNAVDVDVCVVRADELAGRQA